MILRSCWAAQQADRIGALSMIGATVLALLNLRLDLTLRPGVAGAVLTLASLAAPHFAGGW